MFDLNLLEEQFNNKRMSVLLAFGKGLNIHSTVPCIVKDATGLKDIVFNNFCNHNLTTYLLELLKTIGKKEENKDKKVGILVKPCDGKSILELIRENKILKESIVVFSLPCKGIIDRSKLFSLKEKETESIDNIEVYDNKVKVSFSKREAEVEIIELLENKCLRCDLKASPIADYVIGEKELAIYNQLEKQETSTNREFWVKEYARCIRCNACRKVCPLCYCTNCVLEKESPQLVGQEVNANENGVFLMVRAMHLAGRCISCGRCKEVCPVGINHEGFHLPVSEYVSKTFDFKSGENLDAKPILSCSNMEEKEDFK